MILTEDAVSPRREAGDQPHEPRRRQLPVLRRAIISWFLENSMSGCACIFNIITVMYLCKLSGSVSEPLLLIMNQCYSRKLEHDYATGWTSGEGAGFLFFTTSVVSLGPTASNPVATGSSFPDRAK